ncbi:hypothetical protein BJ508DRAFT_414861 [Ascobolus immersus RN42]|uniref:Uncharacterized protein n=1 Tax=Ascobolus immersus RN42 TaxID=1160509 RepID=A0A3N4I559_ASCIM|nr:hypothetical protein BJ508DRAFT_414861 [Ascobolus immersus RN42]
MTDAIIKCLVSDVEVIWQHRHLPWMGILSVIWHEYGVYDFIYALTTDSWLGTGADTGLEAIQERDKRGLLRKVQINLIEAVLEAVMRVVRETVLSHSLFSVRMADWPAEEIKQYFWRIKYVDSKDSRIRMFIPLLTFMLKLRIPSVEDRIWRYLQQD